MSTHYFITSTTQAFIAAVLAIALVLMSFLFLEPQIGQAATSGPFTVRTTILDETSFLVNAANVTATSAINGLTGGTANGSTTVVVRTNSSTGYYMTIAFASNGTGNAMLGNSSLSDAIRDYPASSTQPTYSFHTGSTSAVFAYTVSAANSSDLDQSFLNNGSNACNTGSTYTADRCWMEPTDTSFQIINRTTSAPAGATTTLSFRVYVPNNPSPSVVADTYTATATLTALSQ